MPTENYSPNWHVRCVSVPGPDTDLTLHVSFDNARYMFGCGEGTQRAYVQKKLGLKGVEAIFLSDTQNRTRMGLPGVIMTAADGGLSQLNVIGPPDTSHFISTFRSSVMRTDFKVIPKSMPIGKTPHDVTEMYHSSNITVKAVSLVPPALRTTPMIIDSPPIDISKFRPDISTTRPSTMSRPELEAWRDLIVSHMFSGSMPHEDRRDQPKGPFIRYDGTFAASWPEIKYPLPLPTPEEQATELVYILEPPPIRGKFDVKKAVALGVPNGPIRGKLVKGENIEVDDPSVEGGKRIVRPEDCLVGGGPGAVLIIVTCSQANLPSLLESTAFARYQTPARGTEDARRVHMMVHRTSAVVWKTPAYQEWMASFGEETQHFLADTENYSNDMYFRSAGWKMLDLGLIDDSIFQRPHYSSSTPFEAEQLPPNSTVILPNHQVRMHPPAMAEIVPDHDKDEPLPPVDSADSFKRSRIGLWGRTSPEFNTARHLRYGDVRKIEMEQERLAPADRTASQPGNDIVVTTLGTGSAIPSKYRNVSGTLLDIPDLVAGKAGSILLDCGEGTLGQLRRRFGPDGMRTLYSELKMIFISHMHADHHLGLHSILEDRFKHGITTPLFILAPLSIGLHLQESSSWQRWASDEALANVVYLNSTRLASARRYRPTGVERSASPFSPPSSPGKFVSNGTKQFLELNEGAPFTWGQEDLFNGTRRWPSEDCLGMSEALNKHYFTSLDNLMNYIDVDWIQVPWVSHRGQAHGLVLKHTSGWKIVYSGDTRPCDHLVKVGKDATLLIHEATLEDDKAEMADHKGHSTFSQAIKVGRDMRARHVLLNHFSQRYPKVPKLPALMPSADPSASSNAAPSSPNGVAEPIVSISFDLMSIKVSEMWKMAHYMEPISLLFPEEEAQGDDDAELSAAAEKKAAAAAEKAVKTAAKQKAKSTKSAEQAPRTPGTNEEEGQRHGRTNKRRNPPSRSSPSPDKKHGRADDNTIRHRPGKKERNLERREAYFARRDSAEGEGQPGGSVGLSATSAPGDVGIDDSAGSGVAATKTGLTPSMGDVDVSATAPSPPLGGMEVFKALLERVGEGNGDVAEREPVKETKHE